MMKWLSCKIMDIGRRSAIEGDHSYSLGHDDAKHDAASMAIVYDDALASIDGALDRVLSWDWEGLRRMPDHVDWRSALIDMYSARDALDIARAAIESQDTEGEPTP